jgi:NAD(P)-dependent dehydrogenase (short-subunit alcohol dehydrogenase family)
VDLRGSVALVTGAARRLGKAMALGLAAAGADIVVHYRAAEAEAQETVEGARSLGVRAVAVRADLSRAEEIAGLLEATRQHHGRLDLLVNSAASFRSRRFAAIDADEWDRVHAVNLRAPFLCSQGAAQLMGTLEDRRGTPGLIVNISDLSGMTAWRGYAHHAVSKAGLLHLTAVSARELAPGVRVNAIVPGAVLPPAGMDEDAEAWRRIGSANLLQHPGHPEDVVRTLLFLAASDFVTGAVLPVDGGAHLLGPLQD